MGLDLLCSCRSTFVDDQEDVLGDERNAQTTGENFKYFVQFMNAILP